MGDLRIFSYLPNPRVFKATIAARLCGVEVEVRGSSPVELAGWLWDFDARPLSAEERAGESGTVREGRTGFAGRLFKTEAFLDAHPFGTVPAAFSPDGGTGIFESNSIMRAVARLGEGRSPLYGTDAYSAARIDGFLDVSLVFARDSQRYLLELLGGTVAAETHATTRAAFATYLGGIDRALAPDARFLVGENVTLADICFACEMTLFSSEQARRAVLDASGLEPILGDVVAEAYPRAMAHFERLRAHEAFAPDLGPYLEKVAGRR